MLVHISCLLVIQVQVILGNESIAGVGRGWYVAVWCQCDTWIELLLLLLLLLVMRQVLAVGELLGVVELLLNVVELRVGRLI